MLTTETKNAVLRTLADLLDRHRETIIAANREDVAASAGCDEAMLDRLIVDDKKVDGMIAAVEDGIALEDPEGKVLYTYAHDNGMRVENRTAPFGNILIIYESRPDVTVEAALTAFKAGNRILLKGGKEARRTNLILTDLWHQALEAWGLVRSYVTYLDFDRAKTQQLIRENTHNVDLIIPRGGDTLINYVRGNTDIPIIVSGRGNNFLYVDRDADFKMAIDIILNGKQRISVCNALDKVLLDSSLLDLERKVQALVAALKEHGIDILGDDAIAGMDPAVKHIDAATVLPEEFLAARIYLGVVPGVDTAIDCINTWSGKHSATIVTADARKARQFLEDVDCAAVYHNASTRFTDGGQFGFGAEIAISTQKMHFRGPVGIDQLVTNKWVIYGNGQVRK